MEYLLVANGMSYILTILTTLLFWCIWFSYPSWSTFSIDNNISFGFWFRMGLWLTTASIVWLLSSLTDWSFVQWKGRWMISQNNISTNKWSWIIVHKHVMYYIIELLFVDIQLLNMGGDTGNVQVLVTWFKWCEYMW